MSRGWSRLLIALLGFAIVAVTTLKTAPAGAAESEEAKAKIAEGKQRIEQEDYLGALVAFQEAYKLSSKPSILYNIAMCYRALYRFTMAIASFESLLRLGEKGVKVDPELLESSAKALAELSSLVGRVRIEGAPNGAAIIIDGELVNTAPLRAPLLMDPGQHSLSVERATFKPMATKITVTSGAELTVRAALEPVASAIRVDCSEAQAVVFLDGKKVGSCGWVGEVTPGRHLLRIEKTGKKTFKREVDALPQTTAVLSAVLEKKWSGPSALFVLGFSSLAVGLGAGVVGGVFTYKGVNNTRKALQYTDSYNQSTDASDRKFYDSRAAELSDKVDGDTAGAITGYGLGAALITTGIVLLVVDSRAKRPATPRKVTFRAEPGGFGLQF